MATSAGEVEVKLTLNADDYKRLLGESQKQLQDFGSVVDEFGKRLLEVFSVAAITEFFKSSLDAYAENQAAVARLTAALAAQGRATQEAVTHLTDYAQHLQDTIGVSSEAVMGAQSLLVTFGLTGGALDQATLAALNLSAAMGIDLNRAADAIGKAYEGNTSMLKRYGIEINSHIDTTRKFSVAMGELNSKFAGAAAAQADTYTGKIGIMKGAFNDLEIAIGSLLAGPASAFIAMLTNTLRTLTDWVNIFANLKGHFNDIGSFLSSFVAGVFSKFIAAVFDFQYKFLQLLDKLPFLHSFIVQLNADLVVSQLDIQRESEAWTKGMQSATAAVEAKKKGIAEVKAAEEDLTKGIVDDAWTQSQTTIDRMQEEQKRREQVAKEAKTAHEDFVRSFDMTEADMWNFAKDTSNQFFQGFGEGFAKMIVEGKNFGSSMKQVFQDMAESILSYIAQIIAKLLVLFALEQATGVGAGVSMAGGLFSGAFADGGMIGEPSIITGLRSGRSILAGEAGPELVVPMGGSGNQTAAEMGGLPGASGSGGGGGNITINIQGQFIDGDSNSWQKLMREKIIPEIRRFTMSSPTGPFNRTRGVV